MTDEDREDVESFIYAPSETGSASKEAEDLLKVLQPPTAARLREAPILLIPSGAQAIDVVVVRSIGTARILCSNPTQGAHATTVGCCCGVRVQLWVLSWTVSYSVTLWCTELHGVVLREIACTQLHWAVCCCCAVDGTLWWGQVCSRVAGD